MSQDKQTFTDPHTGEEVESTRLARSVGRMVAGLWLMLIAALTGTSIYGLIWLRAWRLIPWPDLGLVTALAPFLFTGVFAMMILFLCLRLIAILTDPGLDIIRGDRHTRWIHDRIARTQHRQRILRSQEQQDVPDTAISRAQPPGEPQPTDAALSIADKTEEAEHLTASTTEEDTADQVPLRQ